MAYCSKATATLTLGVTGECPDALGKMSTLVLWLHVTEHSPSLQLGIKQEEGTRAA
jgi:hypothetical protein